MYSTGESGMEIEFMLLGKRNRKYLIDVKVIPAELQHRLVVTDLVKKKVVRKEAIEGSKPKEDNTRARFEGRVGELVNADAPDLRKCFKEGVLKACDEVCGKKKGKRDQGDTWLWNEDVKEAIARKKDAHKEMCKSGTEVNKARYKNMKNRAKKVVTKTMKEEAEWELRELSEHPNKLFRLVKSMKKDGKDVE